MYRSVQRKDEFVTDAAKLNEYWFNAYSDSKRVFIYEKMGSNGIADGEFIYPSSVAIDSSGYVYVVETGNSRIQVFSPS